MNLRAPRYALAISIAVCLALFLTFCAGCATAPEREINLTWLTARNPAATCASLRLPYRDGGCVVASEGRCTIVTAAAAVRYADLGRQFRGCLQ